MKKRLLAFLIALTMCSLPIVAWADSAESNMATLGTTIRVEYQNDGSYYVTKVEMTNVLVLNASNSTRTGSKTTTYYGSTGNTLWSVKVTGTFNYNGSTSSCTASTVTATAPASNWVISSTSASKSDNQAKASATAKRYEGSIVVQTASKTVILTCSSKGTLS